MFRAHEAVVETIRTTTSSLWKWKDATQWPHRRPCEHFLFVSHDPLGTHSLPDVLLPHGLFRGMHGSQGKQFVKKKEGQKLLILHIQDTHVEAAARSGGRCVAYVLTHTWRIHKSSIDRQRERDGQGKTEDRWMDGSTDGFILERLNMWKVSVPISLIALKRLKLWLCLPVACSKCAEFRSGQTLGDDVPLTKSTLLVMS